VRLEGEIKLVNVTISEKSTFIFIQDSTIESLGQQIYEGVNLTQNSKFIDLRNINNMTIDTISLTKTHINRAIVFNL